MRLLLIVLATALVAFIVSWLFRSDQSFQVRFIPLEFPSQPQTIDI